MSFIDLLSKRKINRNQQNKYYRYHKSAGHNTDECKNLKKQSKTLIQIRLLWELKAKLGKTTQNPHILPLHPYQQVNSQPPLLGPQAWNSPPKAEIGKLMVKTNVQKVLEGNSVGKLEMQASRKFIG